MKKAIGFIVILLAGFIVYYKTRTLAQKIEIHYKVYKTLGIKWEGWIDKGIEPIGDGQFKLLYRSSDYEVNDIYKSMFGPASIHYLTIDDTREELLWVTELKADVVHADNEEELSGDLLCHLNMDYHAPQHFGRWGMKGRINEDYTRMVTLSSGFQHFKLPKGFGFPVYSNEKLTFDSQVLNLNDPNPQNLSVAHNIELTFQDDDPQNRPIPLTPVPLVIYRPFNGDQPHFEMPEDVPNSCIPVDPQQNSYIEEDGQALTGHWVVPPGREETRFNVTQPLKLKHNETVHHAVVHIHPFCERLALRDITTDSILVDLKMVNSVGKIGLEHIDVFNSKIGVELVAGHEFELILEVNNTTEVDQDMMAVMMLFIRDQEMEEKINAYLP